MRHSHRLIEFWIVLGAVVASIVTALTGFEHENRVTLIGIGDPAIRVLLIWVVAVGFQAGCWWLWIHATEPPK